MQSFMAETLGKVLGNKVRGVAACQGQIEKHFGTSFEHGARCVCNILLNLWLLNRVPNA